MAHFEYTPGHAVESVVSDQRFEEHLRRLAETRRLMMERKAASAKQVAHPMV